MFIRISALAGFLAAIASISIANAKTQRDLSYRNPENGQTYGFVNCEWKVEPRVREVAGAGTCLRQHQGRLQARDGYFTFVHPETSQGRPSGGSSLGNAGN